MKKLTDINVNSPEQSDVSWKMENTHKFDVQRMEAVRKYIKDGDKICDLGGGMFGFGQYYLEIGGIGEVTTVDFSPYAKEVVTKRCPKINYITGNILDTKLPSESFDVVGATEVIEHMEEPKDLAKEMARLVKKGGVIVIGTVDPDCEDAKLNHCKYPEHLWQFTKEDLLAILEPYGEVTYERVGDYDHVVCRCR